MKCPYYNNSIYTLMATKDQYHGAKSTKYKYCWNYDRVFKITTSITEITELGTINNET